MYKTINGWTKERMIEQIYKGNNGQKAYSPEYSSCRYLTSNGNKCAVGCFIPDGHKAQYCNLPAGLLARVFPDLANRLPLDQHDLAMLQLKHDSYNDFHDDENDDVRETLKDWINNHVIDGEI